MKQLLIAAAVSLTLATIPAAFANSSFVSSPTNPVNGFTWNTSCPTDVVTIYNPTKDGIEVFIKVDAAHKNYPEATPRVQGGDAADITCNRVTTTVYPGNFLMCKTKYNVTIKDHWTNGNGYDQGARGVFTTTY